MRYAQLKFAEKCPPGKRGRPMLKSPQDAEAEGIEVCEKQTKDGRTVAYKTGKQLEKDKQAKGERKAEREKVGAKGRGRLSKVNRDKIIAIRSELANAFGKEVAPAPQKEKTAKPETARPETAKPETARPEIISSKWKPSWDPVEERSQKLKKEEKEIKEAEERMHQKMISDLDRKIKENKDPSLGQRLQNFKNDLHDYVNSPNKIGRLIDVLGEMAKKGIITPQTIMASLVEKD